jgi:tetratricopeptide (TPR) repeat protein
MSQNKALISLLTGITAFALSLSAAGYTPKYDTVAHQRLKVEAKYLGKAPNYELLDKIIDESKRRIREQLGSKEKYSGREVSFILVTIGNVLIDNNFIYRVGENSLIDVLTPQKLTAEDKKWMLNYNVSDTGRYPDRPTPSYMQKKHIVEHLNEDVYFTDCDMSSYIYVAVGEAMDLPIKAVKAPDHMLVKWVFPNNEEIGYWETTNEEGTDIPRLITRHKISDWELENKISPKTMGNRELEAFTYFRLGELARKEKRYVDALALFEKALEVDPKNLDVYVSRGVLFKNKGDWTRALKEYRKVLDIFPDHPDANTNYGSYWLHKGDHDKAIEYYNKSISALPSNKVYRYIRGLAYQRKKDHQRAVEDFTKAIELDGGYAEAYGARGASFMQTGKYNKALGDLSKAIELDPGKPTYYYTRGFIYQRKGGYEKALEDFTKCIKLNANYAGAYKGRIWIYNKLGEAEKAEADRKKLKKLKGGS